MPDFRQVVYPSAGDKVTIMITQEYAQEMNGADRARRFPSKVVDLRDDGTIIMEMPMIKRKLIPLPPDLRYTFLFTIENRGEKSFYQATGNILTHYRQDRFFLMETRLISPLTRYQRREFFRIECSLDSIAIELGGEGFDPKQILDAGDFLIRHINDGYEVAHGMISNISGGGALFISEHDFGDCDLILLRVVFSEDENIDASRKANYNRNPNDDTMELLARILDKQYNESSGKYSYRLMFIFKNPKFREQIIKYVFDQQRKQRAKERGGK